MIAPHPSFNAAAYLVPLLGCCLSLSACGEAGADAARQWLANEQAGLANAVQFTTSEETLPGETPVYSSQVADPFAPKRVVAVDIAGPGTKAAGGKSGLFSDVPLAELQVVGYLSGAKKQPVALMRHGTTYRSAHIGEHLGSEAAKIREIGDKGVRVALDDAKERWLPLTSASKGRP